MTTRNDLTAERAAQCIWKCDDIDDYYETACGRAFCFTDGGPVENGFESCPYCGFKIAVAMPALDRLASEGG